VCKLIGWPPLSNRLACGGFESVHGPLILLVSVTPNSIAPVAPLEFELVARSAGWQRGIEPGSSVGKSRAGTVAGGELAGRTQALVKLVKSKIISRRFMIKPSLP